MYSLCAQLFVPGSAFVVGLSFVLCDLSRIFATECGCFTSFSSQQRSACSVSFQIFKHFLVVPDVDLVAQPHQLSRCLLACMYCIHMSGVSDYKYMLSQSELVFIFLVDVYDF